MKLAKLLIPVFALTALVGCEEAIPTEQLVVDAVSEIGALLTNASSGTPYSDRSMTINLTSGQTLSATTMVKINTETLKVDMVNGVEVTITYAIDETTAANWSIKLGSPDATHARLAPKIFDFDDYTSTLTGTIAYGTLTKAVSWTISIAQRGYELVVIPISEVRGTIAVDQEFTTRGYITGTMEPNTTHLYSGVFIADGEYAIMLYAGQLSNIWFQNEFAIGDLVMVTGKYAPYNGLSEMKPTEMAIDYAYAEVTEPVDIIIASEAEFSTVNLTGHDCAIIQVNGLVYQSGKELLTSGGGHVTIKFKLGATDVDMYVNYHVGKPVQEALIALMADWVSGTTTINFHGHLGWYNKPQLMPLSASTITVVA
ncbi:MAG: hypothetical protein WC282_03480 [Bacilli bacterium]|jgi:hypothetical protein